MAEDDKSDELPRFTRATIEDFLKDDPLREKFTFWDNVTADDAEKLAKVIDAAEDERPIQQYLQKHPHLLVQHLGGGHGRWMVPQKRLGAEHITDFIIGDKHSYGRDWYLVELESPTAKMFNADGDPSHLLRHAIRQVGDWRDWLTRNLDYAQRTPDNKGLGLEEINPELPAIIIIGRHEDVSKSTNAQRRRLMKDNRIEIHSYDWLIEAGGGRVGWFATEHGQQERLSERRYRENHKRYFE